MKLIESFGTLNLNEITSNDIQDIIQTVVNTAKQQLQQFAQTVEFTDKMIQTFGTSPAGLQSAWANNVVVLPTIEIVSSSEIDGGNGAFAAATDRIYIAAEFLTSNINNIEAIAKLVLEEYGHKLDSIINSTDTKGDEGAKFAAFVTGENLTQSQLAQLDNENDIAKVTLGGKVVEIEKTEESLSNQIINVQPTANEQYMLTLVNRMRMNPAAEYSLLTNSLDADVKRAIDFFNVDLNLLQDQWNNLIPTNPIAWSEQLNQAAQGHNELMISFDQQSHQLPGEPPLGERVTNAGYQFTNVGESIFAFSESVFYGHAGFAIDWGFDEGGIQNPPGHRENIMNANYREVGIDIIEENNPNTNVGPLVITQNFGNHSEIDNQAWLLGTVFKDLNEDNFYSIGEGLNDVAISITGIQGTTFNNTLNTWEAGGYQILLMPGNYQVNFSQNGSIVKSETVEISTNNVLLDAIITEEVIVNNNPVANNDTATTSEGTAVIINVLANDTDVENNIDITTVEIGTQPTNGTA
ncbi:MAG: CAP domain-containing protein, partial [Nostocales cyanobacterium]